VDFDQREVTLAFLRGADLAGHRVTGAQIETADLRGRDINVVRTRKIVILGSAQEAETIRQAFENAFGEDETALLSLRLEDLEDQLLLAKTGGVENAHVFRDVVEVDNALVFELDEIEGRATLLTLLHLLAALFAGMQRALLAALLVLSLRRLSL